MSVIVKSGGGSSKGLYAWKKLTAANGDFIAYVVADKASKYPNKSVHTDGYYYEKVVEGVDLSALGVSKFETGTYTPSENVQSITLNHSLGVIPKIAIVFNFNTPSGNSYISHVVSAYTNSGSASAGVITNNGGTTNAISSGVYASETEVTLGVGSSVRLFVGGTTYSYILLA